jgi:hypothetical protein
MKINKIDARKISVIIAEAVSIRVMLILKLRMFIMQGRTIGTN